MFNFRFVDLFFLSVALLASSACSVSSNAQKPHDIPQNETSLNVKETDAPQEAWTKEFDGFRFRPFASREDDLESFRRMFPQGTSRAFVEHILVEKAEAKIGTEFTNTTNSPPYIFVSYVEPPSLFRGEKKPWAHIFYYGLDNRLLNFEPFGGPQMFAQPRTCELFRHRLKPC